MRTLFLNANRLCRLGILTAAIAGTIALFAFGHVSPSKSSAASRQSGAAVAPVGAGSCAAASCHGGSLDQGIQGSEYAIWATRDKHARAYAVLFDSRSRTIEKNYLHLGRLEDAHPEKNALCLRCHASEQAAHRADLLADGISCEHCHGPAQGWLSRHYQADWKALPAQAKAELGFRDTRDLMQRGQSCTGCHVGLGDKQVNHDLIAAGHPRLNFELSAYLAIMPKHWSEIADKMRTPDLEARMWFLGQALSAQAALNLLADRADDPRQAWPEFAELDCFACHHDIKTKSWRAGRDFSGRKPGALNWGTWYFPLLDQALQAEGNASSPKARGDLDHLRGLIAGSAPRKQIAQAARQAAAALDDAAASFAKRPFTSAELSGLLDGLAQREENRADGTWDRSTQVYLALAAFVHARNDLDPAGRDPRLEQNLHELAPATFSGPRDGQSPRQPERIRPGAGATSIAETLFPSIQVGKSDNGRKKTQKTQSKKNYLF